MLAIVCILSALAIAYFFDHGPDDALHYDYSQPIKESHWLITPGTDHARNSDYSQPIKEATQ